MGFFWSFTKGAAKTLREEMARENLAEEERLEWERRLQFQQKVQEEAEKHRHEREVAFKGYDPKSKKFYEQTRGGERSEYDAPQGYVDEYEQTKKREQEELDRKLANESADNARADKQLAISGGYLAANREQMDYNRKRDSLADMAKMAEAGLGYGAGGGVFPSPTKKAAGGLTENTAAGAVERAYASVLTRFGAESPQAVEAARIRASGASQADKFAQLQALENPGAGASGGPSIGQIEDGYEYIGGPPGDPNSWRKVN